MAPRTLTRRGVLAGVAACLLSFAGESAVAGRTGHHTQSPGAWSALDARAVVRLAPARRRIALTFDDGPDPEFTPQVLEILRRHRVPATFFLIGRNARRYPELVRRIRAEGHAIGNHSRDHLWLDALDTPAVRGQVDGAAVDLAAAGAGVAEFFRPPRGWISPAVVDVVRDHGLVNAFWTACLESHLHHGPDRAVAELGPALRPGAILLCHDGGSLDGPNRQAIDRTTTVAALPGLLDAVLARGLTPVTLSRD